MSFCSFAIRHIPGLLPATTTIKFNGMRSAFVCMLDSHSQLNFEWKFTYMLGWVFSLLAQFGILFVNVFFFPIPGLIIVWASAFWYHCVLVVFFLSLPTHKMFPLLSGGKYFFSIFVPLFLLVFRSFLFANTAVSHTMHSFTRHSYKFINIWLIGIIASNNSLQPLSQYQNVFARP